MRNSYWLVTFLLVLECVVLLIEPSECILSFIPMSVQTALQILTLLVKIKSIIFKILLGLKLMGVEGFIVRRRRRSVASDTESTSYHDMKMDSLSESERTELLTAWSTLERLLGQGIQFQEDACVKATYTFRRRPISIWDGVYLSSASEASNNNTVEDVQRPLNRISDNSQSNSYYSNWVSTILGSALGSSYACHILDKELSVDSPSSPSSLNYVDDADSTIPIFDPVIQTGAFS